MEKQSHPLDENQNHPLDETSLLMTGFGPVVLIGTYKGGHRVIVEAVRTYDIVTNAGVVSKRDVMFAIKADTLEAVKTGIAFDANVKKRNLRTAIKIRDRPKVLRRGNLERAANKTVHLVMRSGHILRGRLVRNSRYNLVLEINQQTVLVYKHGVLEFKIR